MFQATDYSMATISSPPRVVAASRTSLNVLLILDREHFNDVLALNALAASEVITANRDVHRLER